MDRFPRRSTDFSGNPFPSAEELERHYRESGYGVPQAVIELQREIAGLTYPESGDRIVWGVVPGDQEEGELFWEGCADYSTAFPSCLSVHPDGHIEDFDVFVAESVQIIIERDAFFWESWRELELQKPSHLYLLEFSYIPDEQEMFLRTFARVAEEMGFEEVPETKDRRGLCWSYGLDFMSYGPVNSNNPLSSSYIMLTTSLEMAQSVHAALSEVAPLSTLKYKETKWDIAVHGNYMYNWHPPFK